MLPPQMETPRVLVIKATYGESIKRLTFSITGNKLDVNISKLREKFILVFNLSPSADFVLTYSDIDGDIIMLDDDDDLSDAAINQKLNPLRINVQLRSQRIATAAEPRPNAANPTKTTPASHKSKEPKVVHVLNEGTTSVLPSEKGSEDNTDADKKTASEMQHKGKAVMQNASHRGPFCTPQPGTQSHMRHSPRQNVFPKGPFFGPQPGPPPYENANAPSSDIPSYLSRCFRYGHLYRKEDGYENTFPACHRGIVCDGCDTTPIFGPRYKSIVKDDYDLCAKCFTRSDKPDEYMKIGMPAPSRMPWDSNAPSNFCSRPPVSAPVFPARGPKMRSKLESRLIQDVTVPDGTIMPPSMSFTKIWRMRNNGSSPWPFGTQLVWVGGDQLTTRFSVQLEIPSNGIPINGEIDIAVDFHAPTRAGKYLSYWRLATIDGQKFGQKVWVFFKVRQHNSSKQDIKSTIIFTPDRRDAEMTNVQYISEPSVKNTTSNDELILEALVPVTEPEINTLNGPNAPIYPTVSYPLIDVSPTPEDVAEPAPSVPIPEGTDNNEDILLKQLEEMGFKQIDLNKEVLRLNKYDLEQSVQDLSSLSEWDPLLEELREMGFNDQEKNKKLLVNNGGSIKRVVMDLITGEKAE